MLKQSIASQALLLAVYASSSFASQPAPQPWREGISYARGEQVIYQEQGYVALVAHTAYSGSNWNPQQSATLWQPLPQQAGSRPVTSATPVSTITNWSEGRTYAQSERVRHAGIIYAARVAHTAFAGSNWQPQLTPSLWYPLTVVDPIRKPTSAPTPSTTPSATPSPSPRPSAIVTATPSPSLPPVLTPPPTPVSTATPLPFRQLEDADAREKISDWMSILKDSRQYPTAVLSPVPSQPMSVPVMPVRPEHGLLLEQNPPTFTWPLPAPTREYQSTEFILEIRHPDGQIETVSSPYNWYLPRKLYAPGTYAWRVTGKGLDVKPNQGKDLVSGWRNFTISATAMPLVDQEQLAWFASDSSWYRHVSETAHPRLLPEADIEALRPVLTTGERAAMFRSLISDVKNQANRIIVRDRNNAVLVDYNLPAMPVLGTEPVNGVPPRQAYILNSQAVPVREHRYMSNAALVWRVYRHSAKPEEQELAQLAFKDLKDRLLNLASWPGLGLDAYVADTDSGARWTMLALMLGYDQLHDALSPAERAAIVQNIRTRHSNMEKVLIGKFRQIERHPMDSHNVPGLLAMGAVAAVMAGDGSAGQALFDEATFARYVPLMYAFGSPWGGSDGGWGNSGAYGMWQPDNAFPLLDALKQAAQVDPYRLMQQRNYMRWHMLSILPGNIPAPFGDGVIPEGKTPGNYARIMYSRNPTQDLAWYSTQLPPATGWRSHAYLTSPVISDAKGLAGPAERATSALFESVGQVTMHSRLEDPARTTIHFRSSPYGAYNHSHANQNAFTVGGQGNALLISTGVYDYYHSPHALGWARQTRASNALTYDGGIGQLATRAYGATGRIRVFHDAGDFTITTGDATRAYDPATIQRALRTLVYLKDNLLLVHDDASATRPVSWEWNFHTLEAASAAGGPQGMIAVQRGQAKLCMQQLAGSPLARLAQTDQYAVNPSTSNWTPTHHAVWSVATPGTSFESLVLIDIGCQEGSKPVVQRDGSALLVKVRDREFRFEAGKLPQYR
ncbi:carbohydrate-binding protein [Chitinilyticum litopenaei]|uniref:carbohydrate-binding protein n=1 Tax=Chitinilyticum litopenaei TaxID=1121276 RepID=UPI0004204533|nr:carbohydrate-binding protein [Chitinilyticum litopenaei]